MAARDAGDQEEFVRWVGIFVARRLPMVEGLVALKVAPEHQEDVVQEVLASALGSIHTIRGEHTGEFVNWLKAIVTYRIADHHQWLKRERDRVEHADEPHSGEEGDFVLEITDPDDHYAGFEMAEMVARRLAERSDLHQRAIRLRIEGYPSREVAETLGEDSRMTPANVDQIFSRFRRDLRRDLERLDD